VSAVETFDAFDEATVLRLAGSLDQVSSHVLAAAIVDAAHQRGQILTMPADVGEEPGAGISGTVGAHRVALGKRAWVAPGSDSAPADATARRAAREGRSTVFCAIDGRLAAILLLEDPIRSDAEATVTSLRRAGVGNIVMLTGDQAGVAERVGAALGLDGTIAQLSPEGKIDAVRLAKQDGATVMVGDGINDAPALASADVGVAMGARGATASSEAADVVLLVDRLDRLTDAFAIAQRTRAIALQSVLVGMGLSFGAMIFALAGLLPPPAGALFQEAIDLAVILNALRALSAGAGHAAGGPLGSEAAPPRIVAR
jgi:P-type E1-E2 ATPase